MHWVHVFSCSVIDECWKDGILNQVNGLFLCLCQQHSTRRRRAPRALLDISHAATWPCVSPSSCTATASTTAGITLTRRTAVSRCICGNGCLCTARQQIRGSRGGEASIGLFEINYILRLCVLNLLSVCLFNCFSLGEVWMLIVMVTPYVTLYFKRDLFAQTKT